jgi:excisionase family DNA binding protein
MKTPVRFSVALTGLTRAADLPLLSPKQVGDRCNVSSACVIAAINRGELKASRLGRQYRIREDAVGEWIESQTVQANTPPLVSLGSLPEPVAPPTRAEAGSLARLFELERGATS